MKKVISLTICFLVVCSCFVAASAEDSGVYENAGQLYEAWVAQGDVPDYISGVWSTDGGRENLTFGVVKGEAGESGQQEILALVRDDSTVTIVYQTYSRNYLYRIQEEVVDAYFNQGLGLMTAGVRECENRVYFTVHIDFAENADTRAMIQQVTEQYGDAVCFEYINAYLQWTDGTQSAPTGPVLVMTNPQNQVISLGFTFALCGIVLAFFAFVEMRRRHFMAVTADGAPAVMGERPISEKEVEAAVRNAEIVPSEALDDRVMQSIQASSMNNR